MKNTHGLFLPSMVSLGVEVRRWFWLGVALTLPAVGSSQPITVTLNPSDDLYQDSYGVNTTMAMNFVGRDADGNPEQAALKFDLSSIGGLIATAKLRFYIGYKSGAPLLNVYGSYDNSWSEAAVSFPSTQDVLILADDAGLPTFAWKQVDVSGFVRAQAAGAKTATFSLTGAAHGNADFGYSSRRDDARYWPVLEVTATNPPVLAPIADQVAYVLLPVVATNGPIDPGAISGGLTYGLASGVETGATVNRTNGVFCWIPSRSHALTTNTFSVWMTNAGSPLVCATNSFVVRVDGYVELGAGEAVTRAGQTNSLPVVLTSASTLGVTNVEALVQFPSDHLSPLALTTLSASVGSATMVQQSANIWRLSFAAASGQAFQGTQQVACVSFAALSNRSAFVPVPVVTVCTNQQTDGSALCRTLACPGRAVIVGQESLIEARPPTNGWPNVVLYGAAGVGYRVLCSSNPQAPFSEWQSVWSGTMPASLSQVVPGLSQSGSAVFFRAQQISGP